MLGEKLVALRNQADLGWCAGLPGIVWREVRIFELEDVELDLEASDILEALLVQSL